jgi:hypothetical protein
MLSSLSATAKRSMRIRASFGEYEGATAADQAAVDNAQLQLSWCYIQSPIGASVCVFLIPAMPMKMHKIGSELERRRGSRRLKLAFSPQP